MRNETPNFARHQSYPSRHYQNDGQSLFCGIQNTVAKETGEWIAQGLSCLAISQTVHRIFSQCQSRAIGVLVPSLTNQVFADVIKGIEQITDQAKHQTMLAHSWLQRTKEEQRLSRCLYNIDGIIYRKNHHSPRTLKMLEVAIFR